VQRATRLPVPIVTLEHLERTARLLAAFVRRAEDGMEYMG
jgi:hypothetical protein